MAFKPLDMLVNMKSLEPLSETRGHNQRMLAEQAARASMENKKEARQKDSKVKDLQKQSSSAMNTADDNEAVLSVQGNNYADSQKQKRNKKKPRISALEEVKNSPQDRTSSPYPGRGGRIDFRA